MIAIINQNGKKALVIDDYGHHPTEIEKTIEAIRESYPEKKISMVFQPHRFSRTKYLLKEFINVFQLPDELLLLPIYPAGEKEIEGVNAENLIEGIKVQSSKKVVLARSESEIFIFLEGVLAKGNRVILMQGAGDISDISKKVIERFK